MTLPVVALLLAIVHRPLLHSIIHIVAVKLAAREHIGISFDIEGSVFTNLVLKNVHAEALSAAVTPLEKISVERVRVDYSLIALMRRGPGGFLKNCEIKNANIVLRDVESPPKLEEPHGITRSVRDVFHLPVFAVNRVSVENANLVLHKSGGDLVIAGASVQLDPAREGWLRVARLQIPNVHTWQNISAAASFSAPHALLLRGLTLDENLRFETLLFDGSESSASKWALAFTGHFFGGDASLKLDFADHSKAPSVHVSASARNLSLQNFNRYFSNPKLAGTLRNFSIDASGDPDSPPNWILDSSASAESLSINDQKLDSAAIKIDARDGAAHLSGADFAIAENTIAAQASFHLPSRLADFGKIEINGGAQINATNLQKISSSITSGALAGDAKFNLRNQKLTATFTTSAKEIGTKDFSLGAANAAIQFTKSVAPQQRQSAFFDGLESQISGEFKELRLGDYAMDSVGVKLDTRGQRVRVERADIARAGNTIAARGSFDLPRDPANWGQSFFDAEFSIHAPSITAFNAEPQLTGLNGELEATGKITHRQTFDGSIKATGSNLAFQELTGEKLNVDITIEKSVANVKACELTINANDHLAAAGKITLEKMFAYEGTLSAHVKDIALFQPLLRASGKTELLAGSVAFDWSGSGSISPPAHTGKGALEIQKARYGGIDLTEVKIGGVYFPGTASFPDFHIGSNQGTLDGVLELLEGKLRFRDIQFQRGGEKLTGYIILPVNLARLGKPGLFPVDQRIAAVLNATSLDLEKIAASFGQKSPASGTVTASVFAGGTLAEPTAHLKFSARDLKPKAKPKIEPTDIDANLHFSQNELTLAATVKQRQLQPVDIRGKMPLDIQKTIAAAQLDPLTPLDLKIKMPKSSATALAQFAPIVRYVEGQMAFDAQLAGTVAKPQLSGAVTLDLPAVRLRDPSMPAVNNFKIDLRFTETRLAVERFSGDVSGGPFSLAGKIGFEKLTEPVLDLRFRSQNLLVARDESLTVRADSDLKIAGPFNAAGIAGNVSLTKSRFVRDVEILPIELPGRPAPKPQHAATGFSLGPPFANWKFDVAIKTKDAFLIRGNLTSGGAAADLKLAGTGSKPTLNGVIRLENLTAALPFSKLEINRGFVYFSPDNPFDPTLDIQGSSSMRDYNISVYIFGTASKPQTLMSSEPPLPQEDIVSLLATGATQKELTGSGNTDVIAGRAAVLAFQELYRKIFKRKPAGDNESFFSRFAVDVGAVDPQTGKQQVSTRFKLADSFYLIGDVGVQGDVSGQVKYLIRFR